MCYFVRGRTLGIHQGGATHFAACGTVCGGGVREGTMLFARLWPCFQSLPPLPASKLGPPGADSGVGGFVYILGPHGSLQWTLLWGWEFLLLPQPPQVFTARGLRLYFPALGPWVAQSVSFPSCFSRFIHTQMWDHSGCELLPHPLSLPATPFSVSPLPYSAACLHPSYQSEWMFLL